MDWLLQHASAAYSYDYFGVLFLVAVLEWVLPRRGAGDAVGTRWLGNTIIAVLNTVILRLLFPLGGVLWAAYCVDHGWGLLNQIAVPFWPGLVLSVALLDLFGYLQHYLNHRIPLLWRFHLTHHTDPVIDVTTGLRFHPGDSIVTTGGRLLFIAAAGLPPIGVLVFEVLSIAMVFLEHANVRIPDRLERALRPLIFTPELHRTHHSQDGSDSRTNFGNFVTWWDRLFGTYREHPVAGEDRLEIGVRGYLAPKHLTVGWMLAEPFVAEDAEEPRPTQAGVRSA